MNIKVFNKGSDQNGNKYYYNGCCVACFLLLFCHVVRCFTGWFSRFSSFVIAASILPCIRSDRSTLPVR